MRAREEEQRSSFYGAKNGLPFDVWEGSDLNLALPGASGGWEVSGPNQALPRLAKVGGVLMPSETSRGCGVLSRAGEGLKGSDPIRSALRFQPFLGGRWPWHSAATLAPAQPEHGIL